MEKYADATPQEFLTNLAAQGFIGINGRTTYDSPWQIKQRFYPIELTPREAKSLVENEDPNAEFRYINPGDPSRGLAIRSEKQITYLCHLNLSSVEKLFLMLFIQESLKR